MQIQYNYKFLIKLCNAIHKSADEIKEIDNVVTYYEWRDIVSGATEEIKEKLYTFSENSQRTGFINHVFESIFSQINCIILKLALRYSHNHDEIAEIAADINKTRDAYLKDGGELEFIEMPWDNFFLDQIVHDYTIKCECMLSPFIFDISELCYTYGMKFEQTIDKYLTLKDGEISDKYLYRISTGEYRDPSEKIQPVAEPIKLAKTESAIVPLLPLTGLTLWDLFLDSNDADKIKSKLIAAGHIIVNNNGTEFFKPSKPNTSYEPESLRQALNFNQLLDTKVKLSSPEIIKILSNTFHGFSCHVDTLSAKGMPGKVSYYMTLCKLD
jgi:hypothetical protein